jgi:hypothetical protein
MKSGYQFSPIAPRLLQMRLRPKKVYSFYILALPNVDLYRLGLGVALNPVGDDTDDTLMIHAGRQYDTVEEFRKYIIYLAEFHTDGRLIKACNSCTSCHIQNKTVCINRCT